MSDEPNDDDLAAIADMTASDGENEVIRTLRQQAKEAGREARAEAEAAKREVAFLKAGIDPDDPQQGYFVRGYQGEVSATAIKEAAEAAGFIGAANTSEPQGMTNEERQTFAATGEAAAAPHQPAPQADLYADLRGINPLRSGVTPDQFNQQIAQIVAAQGGDVAYEGPQGPITPTQFPNT